MLLLLTANYTSSFRLQLLTTVDYFTPLCDTTETLRIRNFAFSDIILFLNIRSPQYSSAHNTTINFRKAYVQESFQLTIFNNRHH